MPANQLGLPNYINVTFGWDPPTDSGGRDDLTYTVTISPPAQLSATVVTSTSVTVSAADYNADYTVSVVATNSAGNSTAGEYSFRVGEFCAVYLKDGCLHSTEGMITYPPCVQNPVVYPIATKCLLLNVYIRNELQTNLDFVVCYPLIHLSSLASQEGVLSSLTSLVMVPLDQSLAEYKVQQ